MTSTSIVIDRAQRYDSGIVELIRLVDAGDFKMPTHVNWHLDPSGAPVECVVGFEVGYRALEPGFILTAQAKGDLVLALDHRGQKRLDAQPRHFVEIAHMRVISELNPGSDCSFDLSPGDLNELRRALWEAFLFRQLESDSRLPIIPAS